MRIISVLLPVLVYWLRTQTGIVTHYRQWRTLGRKLEGKGSTEDVFFVPRVNFITGETPSSTNSRVTQRTFTRDTSDSLDMDEQNYGAEQDYSPDEFGVYDNNGNNNAVELSRPARSKSFTATFGVDQNEFSYKSYENIIDSFANVAQQNYKLWLNRV